MPSREILGVVLSTKYSGDTISLWHRTATDAEIVATLKRQMEELLDMQEGMHLEYENFKEALNAPKKEPRQFQRNYNNEGGERGGFQKGGHRGRGRRGGGNFNNRQEANEDAFDRSSKPAATTAE